jgi:hypothetical protein
VIRFIDLARSHPVGGSHNTVVCRGDAEDCERAANFNGKCRDDCLDEHLFASLGGSSNRNRNMAPILQSRATEQRARQSEPRRMRPPSLSQYLRALEIEVIAGVELGEGLQCPAAGGARQSRKAVVVMRSTCRYWQKG